MSNSMLGCRVVDRITGFAGVVVGCVEYLTGCNQCLVVPPVDPSTGALRDGHWLDEQRLQPVVGSERISLDNGATPGHDIAPSRTY